MQSWTSVCISLSLFKCFYLYFVVIIFILVSLSCFQYVYLYYSAFIFVLVLLCRNVNQRFNKNLDTITFANSNMFSSFSFFLYILYLFIYLLIYLSIYSFLIFFLSFFLISVIRITGDWSSNGPGE